MRLLDLARDHGLLTPAQTEEWRGRAGELADDALLDALGHAGLLDAGERDLLRSLAGMPGSSAPSLSTSDRTQVRRGPVHATEQPEEVADTPSEPGVPRAIGRYTIRGVLGRGGMGVVYRAFDPSLNRTVALKLLPAGAWTSPDTLVRFQKEAQLAARLAHPNIVRVHEIGTVDELHYFTMDCVEGCDLEEWLRANPGRLRAAVEILARTAEALDYAHRHGVVHRDIKPGNILVGADGTPYLADLGLGRETNAKSTATATGTVLGTPAYMPPEQAAGRNREVDALSDVYSLGAVLYTILTGKPPFGGGSIGEILHRVMETEPCSPRSLDATVPLDLEVICLKCLEKDKDRRYPSAAELARDLRRFLAGEPITARPSSRLYRIQRWMARRKGLSASLAVGIVFFFITALRALGPARLTVPTHPRNARVTLDGRPIGSGWCWPFGGAGLFFRERSYLMRIQAPGYEPWEETVYIGSFTFRQYDERTLKPDHGFLAVDSDPSGAMILVDGQPVDVRTPAAQLSIRNGIHRVELRLEGHHPWASMVRIDPGVTFDLVRVALVPR